MTELILSTGQSLDLGTETRIVQTFQANNLERPEQIQSNYTNRFEVPATQPNREALEFADETNATTGVPYRKLDLRIISEGVETVPYGIGILEESQKWKFVMQVLSGNKNFFEVLGDKSIRDLPLSEFDHDFTLQNVVNSRAHEAAQGYVYDIIHRGKENQQAQSRFNDLYPSTFVRVIWDKIFKEAGFAYDWNRDDEGLFDKLLLPATSPPKLDQGYREAREIFVSRNSPEIGRSRHGSLSDRGEKDAWVVSYDKTSPEPFFVGEAGRWAGSTYTADAPYYVDVLAGIKVEGFAIVARVRVDLQIIKNGQEYKKAERTYENGGPTAKKVTDFILMDEQKILLRPGDTLQMRVSVHKINGLSSFDLTVSVPEGYGLDIKLRETFPPGGRVRLNNWLPDISQKEFVKSFIFLYGLMMQTDSYTQTIRINYFSDLLKRLDFALDWSDRLTLEPQPVTKYRFGSFVQRNNIRWQGDKEKGENWADGTLTVDDTTLDAEKDIITLPYAATKTESGIPYIEMFKAQKKAKAEDLTEYEELTATPRLLIRQDLQLPYVYLDENDNAVEMPDDSRPVSRFLPELHIKNFIIPRYYDAYQAILTRTRVITPYLLLSAADIATLDFAVPVWIEHFGAYFYVNQISQWEQGKPCEVELVKL